EVMAFHEPSTAILLRQGDRWRSASVAGFYQGAVSPSGGTVPPPAFKAVYDRAMGLALPGAAAWRPKAFKVIVRQVSEETEGAVPWPAEIPQPAEPTWPVGGSSEVQYDVGASSERAARAAEKAKT